MFTFVLYPKFCSSCLAWHICSYFSYCTLKILKISSLASLNSHYMNFSCPSLPCTHHPFFMLALKAILFFVSPTYSFSLSLPCSFSCSLSLLNKVVMLIIVRSFDFEISKLWLPLYIQTFHNIVVGFFFVKILSNSKKMIYFMSKSLLSIIYYFL